MKKLMIVMAGACALVLLCGCSSLTVQLLCIGGRVQPSITSKGAALPSMEAPSQTSTTVEDVAKATVPLAGDGVALRTGLEALADEVKAPADPAPQAPVPVPPAPAVPTPEPAPVPPAVPVDPPAPADPAPAPVDPPAVP